MAERTAHIYETLSSYFELKDFCLAMARLDLTLVHPSRHLVFQLSRDGDQIETTREQLEIEIHGSTETAFQLWFEEEHDLFVRVKRMDRVRVVEIGMEGTTKSERESLQRALVSYFVPRVQWNLALGLVFDPEGIAHDFDWDRYFNYEANLQSTFFTAGLPELVLLESSLAQKLVGFQTYPFNDRVVRVQLRQ